MFKGVLRLCAAMAAATLLSGGVWLERSALLVKIDGLNYAVWLKGRLNAPKDLDLSDVLQARAWEDFVKRLPLQPGYMKADLRVGGRADVEIRLNGRLTPGRPVLGLPFTQESEAAGNLITLRLLEDGTVELRLHPEAAEEGARLRAEVRAEVRRGIPLAVEGTEKPAPGAPYVWRIDSLEEPLRLRVSPPFNFGARP